MLRYRYVAGGLTVVSGLARVLAILATNGTGDHHTFLWTENAPALSDLEAITQDQLQNICDFYDEIATAVNLTDPSLFSPAVVQPTRVRLQDVPDMDLDLNY